MSQQKSISYLESLSEVVVENSLAGLWDWNVLTDEEYLSPRFKEMFGYADHEMENSPESWKRIVFQEDLPGMYSSLEEHIKTKGKTPFFSVLRYRHKQGHTVWVRCNGKVVEWTEDGGAARVIGCHVDITEEKKREKALEKALNEKNVLLAEVHHRVKNNLQLIQSLARLKEKENKLDIRDIEDSINAISQAHEALYRTDRFDEINMSSYLKRITIPILRKNNVYLEINNNDIHENINLLIIVGLVIAECVNNSLKYAFKSDDRKEISIHTEKKDNIIFVTYKDNGIGYDENLFKTIKELDSFGIVLMTSLMDQVEGTINFKNENGAVVELSLPAG